jgi:hypothetical protein
MQPSLPRLKTRFLTFRAAALPMLLTAVVMAASTAPPQPAIRRGTPAWLGYLVMFVLLSIVITVSLMPSKRSHQD